jgi:hypothetical protein
MRHPTEGVLRRLLDEPAGVADATAGTSPAARSASRLAAIREDATSSGALASGREGVDVDRRVAAPVAAAPRRARRGPAAQPVRSAAPPAPSRGAVARRRRRLDGAAPPPPNDCCRSSDRAGSLGRISTADLLELPTSARTASCG